MYASGLEQTSGHCTKLFMVTLFERATARVVYFWFLRMLISDPQGKAMTPKISFTSPYGIKELQEQIALLRWITAKIDRRATDTANITNPEDLNDLLEWVALFTREHFGFEQRLLRLLEEDYNHYGRYLEKRVAVHSSFRIQLTHIWIDKMHDDPKVSERLRSLCHALLEDAQAHDKIVAKVVRRNGAPPLRTKPRRGQVAVETAPLAEADILALAGTPHS